MNDITTYDSRASSWIMAITNQQCRELRRMIQLPVMKEVYKSQGLHASTASADQHCAAVYLISHDPLIDHHYPPVWMLQHHNSRAAE